MLLKDVTHRQHSLILILEKRLLISLVYLIIRILGTYSIIFLHYHPQIWAIFTVPTSYLQFRNQYDSDVTVWSPQGRLHQVEYAMEAVKLGSATVGLKNKQYAVLIALKRAVSELSAYQKKVIPIDEHIGISISGLTADARMLR